jgi:crotonobetainyl-CoA:carnitine CoA-transferase CaiB-like acyl-CoA transferase
MAVCAALVRRDRTAEGDTIDVAMTDVLASWTGAAQRDQLPGAEPGSGNVAGYGLYPTADGGWVSLGVLAEDHLWGALARAVALDDVSDLDFPGRTARAEELEGHLAAAIAKRDRDELVDQLQAAGVPVAPVLAQEEVLKAATFRERGLVGEQPWMGHPVRFGHHETVVRADIPPLVEGPSHLPSWSGRITP